MKQWKWFLLIFELALFAVILILPQVDLPEFTFHGGTAPVSAKARATVRPAAVAIRPSSGTWLSTDVIFVSHDFAEATVTLGSDARLSRLCTLLC
jgi:hypothetical protein